MECVKINSDFFIDCYPKQRLFSSFIYEYIEYQLNNCNFNKNILRILYHTYDINLIKIIENIDITIFNQNEWKHIVKNPIYGAFIKKNIDKLEKNNCLSSETMEYIKSNYLFTDSNYYYRLQILLNSGNWNDFCIKTDLIDVLEANINIMSWYHVSENPNAIDFLQKHLDKVNWMGLSRNPNAIDILEANLDKIIWKYLSQNPNAIHLLEANFDKIDWNFLNHNSNPLTILEKNLNKVDWRQLSQNPNAIHILEANLDKIDWYWIIENPKAIHIIEANLNKININELCKIETNSKIIFDYIQNNLHLLIHKGWFNISRNIYAIYIINNIFENPYFMEVYEEIYNTGIDFDYGDLYSEYPDEEKHRRFYELIEEGKEHPLYYLKKNSDTIWHGLTYNCKAIHILEKYPNMIDWTEFAEFNSNSFKLLKKHIHKLDKYDCWWRVAISKYNLTLFKDRPDKFEKEIYRLRHNLDAEFLFISYEYDKIKNRFYSTYGKELIEWQYHPKNSSKWKGWMV